MEHVGAVAAGDLVQIGADGTNPGGGLMSEPGWRERVAAMVTAWHTRVAALGALTHTISQLAQDAHAAHLRVALQFENYDRHYARRVRYPGVGRGRAPFVSIPRCLQRKSVYMYVIEHCTPECDNVLDMTGFPRELFHEFVRDIRAATESTLPTRQGLTLEDRLVLFFFRCKQGVTLGQIESMFHVSKSVVQDDFLRILALLHQRLVCSPETKTINRWPYTADNLFPDDTGVSLPIPSAQLSPDDPSKAARQWRSLRIEGIAGVIDGVMIAIPRPGTRKRERDQGVDEQRDHYNGYKRVTALVFLAVTDVRGRLLGMFGPFKGKNNDRGLYLRTPLYTNWLACFDLPHHVLLADGGFAGPGRIIYPYKRNQISDTRLSDDVRRGRVAHNSVVKFFRSVVEHFFACPKGKFKAIRFAMQVVQRARVGDLVQTLFAVVRWMQDRGHGIPRQTSYIMAQAKLWETHNRHAY